MALRPALRNKSKVCARSATTSAARILRGPASRKTDRNSGRRGTTLITRTCSYAPAPEPGQLTFAYRSHVWPNAYLKLGGILKNQACWHRSWDTLAMVISMSTWSLIRTTLARSPGPWPSMNGLSAGRCLWTALALVNMVSVTARLTNWSKNTATQPST